MNNKNTVVLINKREGLTSFSCLNKIKKYVNRKTGHCGTLDKFASGLLIALCGKYTKFNEQFMGLDKTYIAKIKFGEETDTLDPEGSIISKKDVPSFDIIKNSVMNYIGEISQIPPAYSALHINGKRSYDLVRKGIEVKLEPRIVHVYSSEILDYKAPYLTVKVHVSKGTYIRSYARDLGYLCNSCAYVTELKRISIGPFNLTDAVEYDDVSSLEMLDDSNAQHILSTLYSYKNTEFFYI